MTRAVTWIVLISAVAAATGLFLLKNEVQRLETAVRAERAAIAAERRAIEVLEADWSHLNSPDRLSSLAGTLLDLGPLEPRQTLGVEAVALLTAADTEVAPVLVPVPPMKPTLAALGASVGSR